MLINRSRIRFISTAIFSVLIVVALGACKSYLTPWQIAIGEGKLNLIIEKPITVNKGRANVYIQHGKTIHYDATDVYQANCNLVLNEVQTSQRIIEPQQCKISRFRLSDEVVKREDPLRLASVGISGGEASITAINFITYFYFQCQKQPDIVQMHCQHWDDPAFGEYLTMEQIQQTLGDLMRMEVVQ